MYAWLCLFCLVIYLRKIYSPALLPFAVLFTLAYMRGRYLDPVLHRF